MGLLARKRTSSLIILVVLGLGLLGVTSPASAQDTSPADPNPSVDLESIRNILCRIPGSVLCPVAVVTDEATEAAGAAVDAAVDTASEIATDIASGALGTIDQVYANYANSQLNMIIASWKSLGQPVKVQISEEIAFSLSTLTTFVALALGTFMVAEMYFSRDKGAYAADASFGFGRFILINALGIFLFSQMVQILDAVAIDQIAATFEDEEGIVKPSETPGASIALFFFIWIMGFAHFAFFFFRIALLTLLAGAWPLIASLAMRDRTDPLFRAVTGVMVALAALPLVFALFAWALVLAVQGLEQTDAAPTFTPLMQILTLAGGGIVLMWLVITFGWTKTKAVAKTYANVR